MRRNRELSLIASVLLAVGLAACSAGDHPAASGRTPGATRTDGGSADRGPTDGVALAKDGYFVDSDGTATHFRIEVEGVQRLTDSSVLDFAVTLLDSAEESNLSEFGSDQIDSTFSGFHLVDPVGRRYYSCLREGDDQGSSFGSDHDGVEFKQGVRYEASVYFPALPAFADHVTVISPGTPSEFTGVPVSDAAPPSVAPGKPTSGHTEALPGRQPSGDVWRGGVQDLIGAVELPDRVDRTGNGQQTDALRADVLFAFDSDALTEKAQATIASVANDIRRDAEPGRPVTIVGHTDGMGTAAYNQSLSERRARAVADALRAVLNDRSFTLQASGVGATQPVAKETKPDGSDNPAGRALNRRVEVSYALRPASGTGAAPGGGSGSGTRYRPAAFHASDGAPVAERSATVPPTVGSSDNDQLRLRVYPFYRDGAFVVAVFDLTNVGDGELASLPQNVDYFEDFDRTGDNFGTFGAIDPATAAVYRPVQIGAGSIEYLDGTVWMTAPDKPGRTYLYLPAPPDSATSLTFDAGPFGKVAAVPVR